MKNAPGLGGPEAQDTAPFISLLVYKTRGDGLYIFLAKCTCGWAVVELNREIIDNAIINHKKLHEGDIHE